MKEKNKETKQTQEANRTLESRKKDLRGQIRQVNGREDLPKWKHGRRKAQAQMAVDIGNMKYNL